MSNEDLVSIESRLKNIESLLSQLLRPVQSLSVDETAIALKRAMASGDKEEQKRIMRKFNGGK